MSASFPLTLKSFPTYKNSVDIVDASHITSIHEEIAALQTKVGVDNSTATSSLDYKVDHIPSSIVTDHSVSGLQTTFTAGESLVFGNVCYIKSDGKAWRADATVIATSNAVCMATETITAEASGNFLLYGFVRDDTWNWTVGNRIHLSETIGALSQSYPTDPSTVVQVMGIAVQAHYMLFMPNLVQIERT